MSQFWDFKCSGKTLPNSSCHFPNYKSVSAKILYHFSVSWKMDPQYFFSSKVIYFAQKEPTKVEILRILRVQVKIDQILLIIETTNRFYFKLWITLKCHETWLFYTFLDCIIFQRKEQIRTNQKFASKNKFRRISHKQPKVWHFALWWVPFVHLI